MGRLVSPSRLRVYRSQRAPTTHHDSAEATRLRTTTVPSAPFPTHGRPGTRSTASVNTFTSDDGAFLPSCAQYPTEAVCCDSATMPDSSPTRNIVAQEVCGDDKPGHQKHR